MLLLFCESDYLIDLAVRMLYCACSASLTISRVNTLLYVYIAFFILVMEIPFYYRQKGQLKLFVLQRQSEI